MALLRMGLLWLLVGLGLPALAGAATVTAETADGVTIYGETYFAGLPQSAPLVLLFHQAGSNGRGEYGTAIAPWLNRHGFRAIAWDQRSGGKRYGGTNRTVAGLKAGVPDGFCDAYADLSAALSFARATYGGQKIIVWGSSYSAALVFQLVAKNPEAITAAIGFSPASGGALALCQARDYLKDLKVRAMMLRPGSEMKRRTTRRQFSLFSKQGVTAKVIDMGVHGASMLVDARTGHNMWAARDLVMTWLKDVTAEK